MSSDVREGLREVAITACPPACAMRMIERPKPEEQPVMSQVSRFSKAVYCWVRIGKSLTNSEVKNAVKSEVASLMKERFV